MNPYIPDDEETERVRMLEAHRDDHARWDARRVPRCPRLDELDQDPGDQDYE